MKIRRRCKCGCNGITNYGKKYIWGHNRIRYLIIKIKRRCKCGCGRITQTGNKYINGHNAGMKDKNHSKEAKRKISIAGMGNTRAKGCKHVNEAILKRSISNIKYDPNYPYCDMWKDGEYKKDLRKDYCENVNCRGPSNQLHNHHIDLDKKNCHPKNIMTLCTSCHITLHNKLQDGRHIVVDPKDFITINRPDHITYINKKTRKKIMVRKL